MMSVGADSSQTAHRKTDAPCPTIDCLDIGVLLVDGTGLVYARNACSNRQLPLGDSLDAVFLGARFITPFEGWGKELSRLAREDRPAEFEVVLGGAEGDARTLARVRVSSGEASAGTKPPGAVVLVTTAASQHTLEERMEVANRLASLGRLATRVAHELNNPLDGILRYINLSLRMLSDTPKSKLREYLSESRTGLMRMVQIISDLLEYSRSTGGAFDAAGINQVVEQAIAATAAAAEANRVVVAADFQTKEMPYTSGSRLFQVCVNLIKNAVDAMPDGGRVSIETAVVGEDVVIRVRDTGPGLPDPPARVFEPFYTTKRPGEGTGLGLAICRDFIEHMQGTIDAANGRDGGAEFTVRVPLSSCRQSAVLGEGPQDRDTHETQ